MLKKNIVIALDLEGTLISNAVSQIPRPGLYQFLKYCHENYSRIVIFTAVKEQKFREIARILEEYEKVPNWFANLEYINWDGKFKDLSFIDDTQLNRIIIVDDREEYINPVQKDRWLHIPGYDYPYSKDDCEFKKIIDKLSKIN